MTHSTNTPKQAISEDIHKEVPKVGEMNQKDKYYIEFECHFDEPIQQEELVKFCDEFVDLTKKYKCWPPKFRAIKNPTYDSYGNLLE